MTEIDEMECDESNKQYTTTCDVRTEEEDEGAVVDDLEEGECSSEEEAPAPVEEKREEKDHRRKRSHRRTRSRDRHKRSKRDRERERKELDADEKKKRDVLRKLKALEANMGIEYGLELEEEEEEEETPAPSEEETESGSSESESRSPSRSPTKRRDREKRKRERDDRHGRKKRRSERRPEDSEICGLFMQGKCQKAAMECLYSHDADPPQVWELCKFYLNDRCAKRDKCLYLHKGFPCKFFHTGRQCPDDRESCKFSHEPLNDTTRTLLLKHIETAPKEILGDFPRMSRNEAATSIFQTEAKNKGWITEGPDAVQPPVLEEESEHKKMESEGNREDDQVLAPSHIKLDAIQEKLLKESQGAALRAQAGRWAPNMPEVGGGAPLAVQQAMAMVGGAGPPFGGMGGGPMPGPQSHGLRNNGAFSQGGPSMRRQTVGLLGPGPDLNSPWSGSPFGPGHAKGKGPQSLMDVRVNEEEVESYLIKQRIEAAKVHEEFNEKSDEETPEVTPPVSPGNSPPTEKKLPKLPQNQLKFMKQRIHQKQLERLSSECMEEEEEGGDGGDGPAESGLGAPFSMNNLNLPTGLSNVLAAITQGGSPEQHVSKAEMRDPRRRERERMSQRETEEELDKEKEQRIMDLDLGSLFGDLELPPLTVSPERTDEEKTVKDAFGLPFKPHIMHEVAKEIDASFGSHSPIDWLLKPVACPKPDYSDIKHLFSNSQLEADPRLRKFAKSGMAKLKELPLPSFPPPKSDPRLNKKDPRQAARQPVVDRRRSSEDSDGGQVYNPAKELNKAKKQQQQQQQQQQHHQQLSQQESEAYSPGQEYYGEQNYSPGQQDEYEEDREREREFDPGYPPYDFPPSHAHGFPPPPPRGHPSGWGPPPRGFPPRGPRMDPYFRGQAPYGGHYGPPRGNFGGRGPIRNNGPRRGNFHPGFNKNDPRNRE